MTNEIHHEIARLVDVLQDHGYYINEMETAFDAEYQSLFTIEATLIVAHGDDDD